MDISTTIVKRILILSTRIPFPLIDGARIRIFNTAKYLSSEYDVDLFCVSTERPGIATIESLRQIYSNVVFYKINPIASAFLSLGCMFTGLPLQVHYFYRRRLRKRLERILSDYDVILCNHIRMTEYVRANRKQIVVDLHDSIAMHYERAIPIVGFFERMVYAIECPRVLKYELKTVRKFAKSVLVSEVDRAYLIRHGAPAASLTTINVAVRDDIIISDQQADTKYICFLGKMSYHPNVDAVEWFVSEIFPSIRECHPDVYFYIIGATPSPRVQRLAHEKNVVVTGYVENPFDLVAQSLFMVAPIRVGAGLQNKVLEAMSIGKTVLTTSIGAEGIEGKDGEHYILADTKDAFISQVSHLIKEKALHISIGKSARELIDSKYRWESIGERFKKLIAEFSSR